MEDEKIEVLEPTQEVQTEPASEPVVIPAVGETPTEPVIENAEPVVEPVVIEAAAPAPEPVVEPTPAVEPVVEPTPVVEAPVTEQVPEAATTTVEETVPTEPAVEPAVAPVVEPAPKKKSALPILLVILVLVLGGAAVWYFVLGGNGNKAEPKKENEQKEEEKKEEEKKEEEKEEEEKEETPAKTDEAIIAELKPIVVAIRTTFDQKEKTEELEKEESKYFTENGRKELETFKKAFKWYCFDVAGCTTEENKTPETVFNSTDKLYGDYKVAEKTDDKVTLTVPVADYTNEQPNYNKELSITFAKEDNTWKVDKFIN